MATKADSLGVGTSKREQLRARQVVIKHDIGRAEAFGAAQRYEPRIAWACADEVHFAAGWVHVLLRRTIVLSITYGS